MKTYDIYAKQDGKWQRKGIQGEPTPPECGGSVEGTAIPVGEKVEKIYFNINLSSEETNKYLSQLTYVDIGFGTPLNVLYAQTSDGTTGYFFVVFKMDVESYHICLVTDISAQHILDIFSLSNWGENVGVGVNTITAQLLYGAIAFDSDLPILTDFNGLPIGAENEKIKNVLSITPFGASGGSVDVEDSGLPVEVSTQEEIDALAIGAIFKYTGESGTYENGGLYMVEAGE